MVSFVPKLGDFGLVRGNHFVSPFVRLGQYLNGDASLYSHALVVVDPIKGHAVEAWSSGARLCSLDTYSGLIVYSHYDLTDEQRLKISGTALSLIGTPYSFIDYLAIALHRFGFDWLDSRVEDNSKMICSQLVDYCYRQAGIQLFEDGRMCSDVTPGDLANLLLEDATMESLDN